MFVKTRTLSAILFIVANAIMICGLYFVFDQFLRTTGEEIVKAWYHGEIVNLQEGQILPAIAKNQSLLEKSPFVRSVVLLDVNDPERSLFSLGKVEAVPAKQLKSALTGVKPLQTFRSGFFSHLILAKLPGNRGLVLAYRISSTFLAWTYLCVVGVSILFVTYLMGFTAKIVNVERKRREQLKLDLLKRLSHDLQSPLLSISGLSLKLRSINHDLHLKLEQSMASIRQLLDHTTKVEQGWVDEIENSDAAFDKEVDVLPIVAVMKEIVAKKRAELSHVPNLILSFDFSETALSKCARINRIEFERHIANLIKNSVEAMDGQESPEIKIGVSCDGDLIEVFVSDVGKGIPGDVLPRLGNKGFSFAKAGGSGLGLHYAIQSVKHWGGQLQIHSEEGIGTIASISLPVCDSPPWYAFHFSPDPESKVVIVDDDISMLERWEEVLGRFNNSLETFSTASSFRQWFLAGGQLEDDLCFVFDHHLDGNNTGIDLIDSLGLAKEAILVTSAYCEKGVQSQAMGRGVRILPKVLV